MKLAPYALGLQTLSQEVTDLDLPVQGTLPDWLTGTLLRTGPAQFEVADQSYKHLFDGLAMLYRFSFQKHHVRYSNRFLQSGSYQKSKEQRQIVRDEFGTSSFKSPLSRLRSLMTDDLFTDNCNVNISKINDRMVALTETPRAIIFNPKTLETIERLEYTGDLTRHAFTTAHPHFDFERRQLVSYQIQFGLKSSYQVYTVDLGTNSRKLLCQIPVDRPAYMHSFPISDRYIILVECPLRINPLEFASTWLLRDQAFIENYEWQTQQSTRFLIIDRADGQHIKTCETESFFAFHYVNAFECDGHLIVDASVYPSAAIINEFYLDTLRLKTELLSQGKLVRFSLPLGQGSVKTEVIADTTTELPRINYKQCNGKNYDFVYGGDSQSSHNFIDQLVKVNVRTGDIDYWRQEQCYPGEPVFVSAPDATNEDEGALLSLVLDAYYQKSFLLVLNAATFNELARVDLPHIVPFGFHGQYFENINSPNFDRHLHR